MKYWPLIILSQLVFAQSWHNHPELVWYTIETEHFLIHYHEETKRSGEEAVAVAEKIYGPVTNLYHFEPESKTHIIIKDTDDISNGAAYYYDNKIEIWALPLDFDLRGSHRWMNNVITHEFTHIIQIGAAMKYPRRFPASFFQLMGYEDEKRPDVLYGYPNTIMSYPLPGVSMPPWLAEGTAQFMYPGADFDFWDSHRDMIVRDRVLNDNLLSFNAMNTFGKRGIGNESTYNQGFLFVSWLVERYGPEVVEKISRSLAKPWNYSINRTLEDATGIMGEDLYNEWADFLESDYNEKMTKVRDHEKKGTILLSGGTTNIYPAWSPDNNRFAYLSNQDNDYFGQTDLFIFSLSDSTSEIIAGGVHTKPAWLNDSTIVYTRRSKPDKWGSKYFDLYRYDINEEEEERLTHGRRLISPAYDPGSNRMAAITSFDGTSNILMTSLDSIDFQPVTSFVNGIQLLSLSWQGNDLLVDGVNHQGRQIYKVNVETRVVENSISGFWDNRSPEATDSGLIYASDKSGIFNLKVQTMEGDQYITNVNGGAFMPSTSDDGRILYSLYEDGGYKIAILENIETVADSMVGYGTDYFQNRPFSELILGREMKAEPYIDEMLSMAILPRLMMDYNTLKPGFYFYSNEVLDKFSIFGGASVNKLQDMDLFLLIEYKKYWLTFYSNLFWISRHRAADRNDPFYYPRINGTDVENIKIFNDLTFLLFSSDIGTRFSLGGHKLKLQYNYTNYREHISQEIIQEIEYNDSTEVNHFIGDFAFDYFRGHSLSLLYDLKKRKPSFARNMLPGSGWILKGNISYEWNQFIDGFGVSEEYSTYGAIFAPHNTLRVTAEAARHFTLYQAKKIVGSLEVVGGGISNPEIDDFFHFFGGGLPGIKGYTFYDEGLTGPYYFVTTTSLRIPLFMEKNYSIAQFNFQNLSLGGIFQTAGAIENSFSEFIENERYKLSAGMECRLSGFSFFSYPTAIGYEYHHPLSDIEERGKHYFTLLFDF